MKMNPPFRNHSLISTSDDAPPTTIRTSFQRMNRLISHVESNGVSDFAIFLLVAEILMDSCMINSSCQLVQLADVDPQLRLEARFRWFLDLFDAENLLVQSI